MQMIPDDQPDETARGASAPRQPLYRQIADRLIAQIRSGQYPTGETLPPEVDLAASLGVSRGSVREALQILSDAGVVERVRKIGTRVVRSEPQSTYVQRLHSLNDALGFGGDTVMRIDELRDVEQPDEPLLRAEVSPTGFWLEITGIRHLPADDVPTTWARAYVSGPYSGIRPLLTGEVASIYKLIEQAYALKITRLQHKITAIAVPDYASVALQLATGAPALEVNAWLYSEAGTLIEFVRSIHNPARFSIEFATQSTG